MPALHPRMAEVFRQKATQLAEGLAHEDQRSTARQALRGFLDKIVIPQSDGLLEVVGNLGSMLAVAAAKTNTKAAVAIVGCGGGI